MNIGLVGKNCRGFRGIKDRTDPRTKTKSVTGPLSPLGAPTAKYGKRMGCDLTGWM
jgi:hypothetical protein